jgi:predicted small secreted protein
MQVNSCISIYKSLFLFIISIFFLSTSHTQEISDDQKVLSSQEKNKISNPSVKEPKKITAEEKLETIRETLVSEALRSQARVKASAWLDNSGALHENTHITSEVYSTGVSAQRQIDGNYFDVENIRPNKNLQSCNFYDPHYARVAELFVTAGRSSLELPFHELENIKNKTKKIYRDGLLTRQNWLLVDKRKSYESSYSKFLSSSSLDQPDFSISLKIQTEESFSYRKKINHVTLKLVLLIRDLSSKTIVLSTFYPLPSPWAPPPLEAPRSGIAQIAFAIHEANMVGKFKAPTQQSFSKYFEKELTRGLSKLIKETENAFKCRQIVFPITEIRKNSISINAGSKRGLKIGDQLLLTDSDMIPTRILEESAMEKIALIEVKSVSANKATAVKIAGPNLGPVVKNSRSSITVTPF